MNMQLFDSNCAERPFHALIAEPAQPAVISNFKLKKSQISVKSTHLYGGAKKKPYYHIVAADSRRSRDGRFIEILGFYEPQARGESVPMRLDLSRIEYWKSVGAQLSVRVAKLVELFKASDAAKAEAPAEEAAQA